MNSLLTRYWIKFKPSDDLFTFGVQLGCGVTAYSEADALTLLQSYIFKDRPIPRIDSITANIKIPDLDQGHIVTNMWTPTFRGIWYPQFHHDNN